MFESNIAELDAAGTLAAATDAHAVRTRADLELIELSLRFADLHPDPATIPGHVSLPGGERGWVCGGPGCPGFAEFAAAEFGAAIGRSAGSAAAFIGQSLALRHRLPLTLAMVRSGHAEPWKARTIATACLALSLEAAAIVDRRVASIIDSVTPIQLDKIVKAAIQQADPDRARATAEQNAKERGVWAGRTDEHGSTTLTIRASTGAVIRLKTTLRQIADALTELGHTGTLDQRMATAVGIISDPTLTHELLTIATHLTHTHSNAGPAEQPTTAQPPPTAPATNSASDPDAEPEQHATAPATDLRAEAAPHTEPASHTDRAAEPEQPAAAPATDPRVEATHAEPAPHVESEQPAATPTTDLAGAVPHAEPGAAPGGEAAAATKRPACGGAEPEDLATAAQGSSPGLPTDRFAGDPGDEPGLDDEADRDPPHPSDPSDPGYNTPPSTPGENPDRADQGMDAAARRELAKKLNAIRHNAYSKGLGTTGYRPAQTTLYVHITDHTLLAGEGVTRVERYGPVFTTRLEELLGHDRIIIKPVIDLNDNRVSVNAYEIPDRIRERVKLTHPVEQFPYGPAETTNSTDLDHIQPYNFKNTGPPGQTSIDNLTPLRRYSHRVKTHAGWEVRRLDDGALEWITKHGLRFRVDHKGTHRIIGPP